MIRNPVLRGSNPDPSMVRAGDDYYIATSTFEWFPGVCIYHSRDLEHWRLAARPLDRPALLDMRGEPNSGGMWAPCLSWSDGHFHLVYTDMKRWTAQVKDCHNYLTTAPSIEGPWSDPISLNSYGFEQAQRRPPARNDRTSRRRQLPPFDMPPLTIRAAQFLA